MSPAELTRLSEGFDRADPAGTLRALRARLPGRLVFTTSFGLEDQALTHIIATAGFDIALATLDTGRMFPETYDVWARTQARYGLRIAALAPDAARIEALVARRGVNGFYDSLEARQDCCATRKLEPLSRALAGASGWITGLRADQSNERAAAPLIEWNAARALVKCNPLIGWTRQDAARFVASHGVPINALHDKGFLSIGCAPCTRAVAPGETERSGRWWWENVGAKECGLHVGPDGRLVRAETAELRP